MNSAIEGVIRKIEKLEEEFLIEGVSDEDNGKNGHWSSNNRIKLWSVGRSTGQLLRLITLSKKPTIVLELGTSAGYSTLWIASALENGEVHTVEMSPIKIELAKKHFNESGLSNITLVEGNVIEALNKWNRKIDMVFIDADKYEYIDYIKKIEPHLNDSSVIIADNVINFRDKVKDYVDYIESNVNYTSQLLEIEDGVLVSFYK
jgi:predicted O-methyltransferase YrrM